MTTLTNIRRISLRRWAASVVMITTLGWAAPAMAENEPQTPASRVKASATRLAQTARPAVTRTSKKQPRRSKLSREWVWQKKARNFDSMYRR